MKLLTIAIAAFNVSSTIRTTLDSLVCSSNISAFDILVVDDGSIDDTASIVSEYVHLYPDSIRLIQKQNGGWGSAVNHGMQHSAGKYFLQLDADDYLINIDLLFEDLEETQADLVYLPFAVFRDPSLDIIKIIGKYSGCQFRSNTLITELDNFSPSIHNLIVRIDLLQQNNISITERCFYTDVEYVLKVCNIAKDIVFLPYPLYAYRIASSGQSMSQAGIRAHYKDHLRMLEGLLQLYQNEMHENARKVFETRLSTACYYQYLFFFALACNHEQKHELVLFDTYLRKHFPFFYSRMPGKFICLLRRLRFTGYRLLGPLKNQLDYFKKCNLYEGYESKHE